MRKFVLLGALALCAAGCGGGAVSVSGVVTLNGQPVEGATVTFSPDGGGGGFGSSYGKTDATGRYTLKSVAADKAGAAVGKHRVAISLTRSDAKNPDGAVTDVIPAKYNAKSDLTFDVPSGGTDKADFALTK